MSKRITREILPERLVEHRAVKAWSQLQPERVEPEKIEILKLKDKSAVYRLVGAGPDGSSIIAKKCYAATAVVERTIYEKLLPRLPVPVLQCHGFVDEPEGKDCWPFPPGTGGPE